MATVTWKSGVNGVPPNDTAPILGTKAGAISDGSGIFFAPGEADEVGGSARVHYGGGYIEVTAGSVSGASLLLANGGSVLPAEGQIVITDPTGANEGLALRICSEDDGVHYVDEVTIEDGLAESTTIFSAGAHWWVSTMDEAGVSGTNGIDDLLISVGEEQIAVMRAPALGWPNGCPVVSSVYKIARASTVNSTLTAANRLTAPTGIGSFATSLVIGNFADGDHWGIAIQRTIPPGMPPLPEMLHVLALSGAGV